MKKLIFLLLLQISLLYCKFYLVKSGNGKRHLVKIGHEKRHKNRIHPHKKHGRHHKSVHKATEETTTQNPFLIAGLFEGDINLDEKEERNGNVAKRKNGVRDVNKRWPNGKIPYTISEEYNGEQIAIIKQGRVQENSLNSVNVLSTGNGNIP